MHNAKMHNWQQVGTVCIDTHRFGRDDVRGAENHSVNIRLLLRIEQKLGDMEMLYPFHRPLPEIIQCDNVFWVLIRYC